MRTLAALIVLGSLVSGIQAVGAIAGDNAAGGSTTVTGGGDDIQVIVENEGGEIVLVVGGVECTFHKARVGELATLTNIPYTLTPDQMVEFIREIRNDDRDFFLYVRSCGEPPELDYFWLEEATPADVVELAREELIRVAPDPGAEFSPDANINQLVGLPTFVWLDDATLQPIVAEATIPGLTATATATPARLLLDPGDGSEPLECDLELGAYTPGADPESSCTHAYKRVSSIDESGTWDFAVSLEWDVTWVDTNGGAGVADPLLTESIYPLVVVEAQPRTTNG